MKRSALILLPLVALTACATPREQCINGATRQVATFDRLIAETQGNIDRGFGIFETEEVRVIRRTCQDKHEDGTVFRYRCDDTETFTRREPVALDIGQERVKLAQLQERRAEAAAQAQRAVRQCIATHPE